MTNSQISSHRPGFFSRFLGFLGRLILAILLGAMLGAAFFYGVPALYREFIQPVQEHSQQIQDLQARLNTADNLAAERIATLSARLEIAEIDSDASQAAFAELETLKIMQATSVARIAALEANTAEHQSRLATLEASLKSVKENTDGLFEALNLSLTSLEQRVEDLESAQANNVSIDDMRQQLQLLQSMQLMLRTEFYLSENNYGLAAQDIQTAVEVLGALASSLPAEKAAPAIEVISYLESALADLPAFPVVASNKISTAWEILLAYFQKPESTATPAPPAEITPTPVDTPTPTPTTGP